MGLRVVYSEEASRLETGGGARQALSLLGTEAPFLMISSDVVTDFDFRSLTPKKTGPCPLGFGAQSLSIMMTETLL